MLNITLKDNTIRRRLRFGLCLIFLTLILYGIRYLSRLGCGIPFGSCYHTWVEDVLEFSLFCFGIIISYMVTIDQYKNKTRTKFVGNLSVLLTSIGLLAVCVYHFFYKGNPKIFMWDNMESVIPFHIQLGTLFFMNFITLNFFVLFLTPIKRWLRLVNLLIAISGLLLLELWKK